jgi:AraC family transcriptional regulator
MTQKLRSHHSQYAIHPSDLTKDEWRLARQSILDEAIVIEHLLEPPNEIEAPALTHNAIYFQLNDCLYSIRHDDQEFIGLIPAGAFILNPTGVSAYCRWEGTIESLSIAIHPNFLQQIALEMDSLNPDRVELLTTLVNYDAEMGSIAHLFKRELDTNAPGGSLYAESLATILGIHLLRHHCAFKPRLQQYQGGLSKSSLHQAIAYIHAHLADDVSLAAIATHLNISQYYFIRLFKQSTGLTPYQYVLQQRIERAKQLLRQGNRAIADVALECGFTNQSNFTRAFRRATGMTPKAYQTHL